MQRNLHFALMFAVVAAGVLAVPPAAQAWWRGGFTFGFVPYVPTYPYYYPPPPVYYPPPPVYAPPPAYATPGNGPACYAGPYVCPLSRPAQSGAPCSCPTNDSGRVGGRVG